MDEAKLRAKKFLLKYCPSFFKVYWGSTNKFQPEICLHRYLCNPTKLSIDVGADRGVYTAMALLYSKACYAFEPQPAHADQIRKFFSNLQDRVVVEEVALSDSNHLATLRIPVLDPGRATVEKKNNLLDVERLVEIDVLTRRLDDYGFRGVGFIKIDVEGHEESVVRGATQTIGENRPNLFIEIEERHNPGGILRLSSVLRRWSYEGFFLHQQQLLPLSLFSIQKHQNEANIMGSIVNGLYINNFIFSANKEVIANLHDHYPAR